MACPEGTAKAFRSNRLRARRERLEDAGARALLCADGFLRRGTPVPMLATARAAVAQVPSVETLVVVPRIAPVEADRSGPCTVLPWPAPDAGSVRPSGSGASCGSGCGPSSACRARWGPPG